MTEGGRPAEELWRHLLAGLTAQAIGVAAQLDVAEHISGGELDVEQISARTGAIPGRLYRVLRLLASQDIFRETSQGRFANTPLSEALRPGHPASQRDFAIYVATLLHPGIADLLHAVTSPEPSFDRVYGEGLFDYLTEHPDQGAVFTRAMDSAARLRVAHAQAYDWPEAGIVVDVGGGDGPILAAVLGKRPNLRGVVFDLPHLASAAEQRLVAEGIADRCRFVGGSFFEKVWAGGDIYLLSSVIHDWDDGSAVKILANCREAIRPDGRLLILDIVLPASGEWHPGKVLDVVMLALTSGRERTEAEWIELLDQTGFGIVSITPSQRVSLIEAEPTGASRTAARSPA